MPAAKKQVNFRVDADVKASGEAALKRAGYTPSQAYAGLLQYAAANAGNTNAIARVIDFEAESKISERIARAKAFVEEWRHKDQEFLDAYCGGVTRCIPDDELREMADRDKYLKYFGGENE